MFCTSAGGGSPVLCSARMYGIMLFFENLGLSDTRYSGENSQEETMRRETFEAKVVQVEELEDGLNIMPAAVYYRKLICSDWKRF